MHDLHLIIGFIVPIDKIYLARQYNFFSLRLWVFRNSLFHCQKFTTQRQQHLQQLPCPPTLSSVSIMTTNTYLQRKIKNLSLVSTGTSRPKQFDRSWTSLCPHFLNQATQLLSSFSIFKQDKNTI